MKEPPSAEVIEEAAIELAVHPAFVEKDWYAVQVLKAVVGHGGKNEPAIFSGGTSLSKGHALIQRFSEDLDFIVDSTNIRNRADRREFRQSIIGEIDAIEGFSVVGDSIEVRDNSKFFSFRISYPQHHAGHQSLRPYLKLELSFRGLSLAATERPIRSFIAELKKNEADTSIRCVKPVETAADKFNALVWRIKIKDREREEGSKWNEPQIMRHLHDLCALEQKVLASVEFADLVRQKFPADAKRGGLDEHCTLQKAAAEMIEKLETESLYREEYSKFVDAMSYAVESEKIDFDTALHSLKRIGGVLE